MTKPIKPKIAIVYLLDNGMCMVYDRRGQPMLEYEGIWEVVKEKIERDKPKEAVVKKASWR